MNQQDLVEQLPARLELVDRGGNWVRRLSRAEARHEMQRGTARWIRDRRGRITGVQWIAVDSSHYEPGQPSGRKYSYDHETDTNPRGVWALVRIPRRDRKLFLRVLLEVLRRLEGLP